MALSRLDTSNDGRAANRNISIERHFLADVSVISDDSPNKYHLENHFRRDGGNFISNKRAFGGCLQRYHDYLNEASFFSKFFQSLIPKGDIGSAMSPTNLSFEKTTKFVEVLSNKQVVVYSKTRFAARWR
jgi:hypothetical protein